MWGQVAHKGGRAKISSRVASTYNNKRMRLNAATKSSLTAPLLNCSTTFAISAQSEAGQGDAAVDAPGPAFDATIPLGQIRIGPRLDVANVGFHR